MNVQSFCQPWTKVALYPFSSNRAAKLSAVIHRQHVFLFFFQMFLLSLEPSAVLSYAPSRYRVPSDQSFQAFFFRCDRYIKAAEALN